MQKRRYIGDTSASRRQALRNRGSFAPTAHARYLSAVMSPAKAGHQAHRASESFPKTKRPDRGGKQKSANDVPVQYKLLTNAG